MADEQNVTYELPVLKFDESTQTAQIIEPKGGDLTQASSLTPEEQALAREFAEKIDIRNSNGILQYGAGAQKKIADFSDDALGSVRTKDLGEIGEMLSGVVNELKGFDAEEQRGGLFGLFKKAENRINTLKNKYAKAEVQVEKITEALETYQIQLLKDIAVLDKMYDQNLIYFKELSMYIEAGKMRLDRARTTELPELLDKAQASGLPEDAQAAKDFDSMCIRLEKKVHDLELTRMISIQTAPQIRLVQNSDTMMAEKIQSTLVNTIPLWKSQMVLALGVHHVNQAAEAQRQVTEMTNDLLRKNAETLKTATIESAKESERGIVEIETLQNTNNLLIETLDEVMQIQADGRAKRAAAEAELARMEGELKQKLIELR